MVIWTQYQLCGTAEKEHGVYSLEQADTLCCLQFTVVWKLCKQQCQVNHECF